MAARMCTQSFVALRCVLRKPWGFLDLGEVIPTTRKVKGKGQVLDIALLHNEHMLRSALQSQKWQLIGMS